MKKALIILSIIAIGGIIGYFYAENEKQKEIKENQNKYIDVIVDWEIDNEKTKNKN